MKSFRTAIIGCGSFAKRHAAHLARLDEISLIGFCDSVVENAQRYQHEYGGGKGRVFDNYEEMFTSLDLDLVYICLPPFAHGNEVELACKKGVHFLLEKPIALTLEKALEMQGHVNASGVKCQVGFMYRFGEAVQRFKQYQSQQGGQQAYMIARYACNSLHSPWWRDRTKSGGQLVEQVIHILDLTRFFLGEPTQVFSMQNNLFHQDVSDYTVEDASVTGIRFSGGGMASISATNGAIPGRWDYDWRMFLPGVTADFTDANHAVFHNTAQSGHEPESVSSEEDMYLLETLDLLDAIRKNRQPRVPIAEGVNSLKLALAAAKSAEEGKIVDVV